MSKTIGQRYMTFLVAVTAEAPRDAGGAAVYAVMARCADEALQIVRTHVDAGPELTVVGSLSSRMAKAIRLAAGEMRLI